MPAIGLADNLIKVKVSCECNESHDEFDDYDDDAVKKESQAFNPNEIPLSLYLQQNKTHSRLLSFSLLSILSIWFILAFWLILSPPSYCQAFCSDPLYDTGSPVETEERALLKLEKHLEKFNELSSLYGRYFNVSDDKINSALQDAHLWFIIYSVIGDDDLTEQDKMFIRRNYFRYYRLDKLDQVRSATMRITSFLPKPLQTMIGVKEPNLSKISNNGITKYYAEKKKSESHKKEDTLPSARLSANGQYLLYDKVTSGMKYTIKSKTYEVTLATQSSVDRLKSFAFSASKWTGPISLAVFVNGSDQYCAFKQYLQYMKRCKTDIFDRTTVSLATPKTNNLVEHLPCHLNASTCSSLENSVFISDSKKPSPAQGAGYPQNTMRNLAKYNSQTPYHVSLDVDIIPSAKMAESLNKFLKGKPVFQSGLVIPTYEVSIKAKFPDNKAELVNLRRKGQAQPFHKEIFALNQNDTNFTKWEKIHDTFDDVNVVYDVERFHLYYEPFFVEHRSGLLYNESFIGYGFTRSSHAYETFLKNGNFKVLSPVFTVQLGLQKVKEWSPERQKQNTHNRFIFQRFVANLHNGTVSDLRTAPLFT